MTENVGDSGLRFEIWFRRRKSQDTFILQASSSEVKAVWTAIIGKILWRQALRNRGTVCILLLTPASQFYTSYSLHGRSLQINTKKYLSRQNLDFINEDLFSFFLGLQSCACRRWFPWGLEANLSWTSSLVMQPSVTEPLTI